MATVESKILSDIMMQFVQRGIYSKEQLGDLSKGDCVKLLYKITNLTDYWNFVEISGVDQDD